MSKVLESLERLKTAPSFMGGTVEYQACTQSEALLMQDYEIVRQALLKAQKEHKALEIIKEKDVDVKLLKLSTNLLDYYTRVKHKTGDNTELTEEEFELLKELLKDE